MWREHSGILQEKVVACIKGNFGIPGGNMPACGYMVWVCVVCDVCVCLCVRVSV